MSAQASWQVCLSQSPKSQNLKNFTIREIFSSTFPGIFPQFSSRTPEQIPETATAFSSFLILPHSDSKMAKRFRKDKKFPPCGLEGQGVSDKFPTKISQFVQRRLLWRLQSSGTKKTAQRESFRARKPGVIRADVPGQKLRGPSKTWKNKHLGVDIHDPNAGMSTTWEFPNLYPKDPSVLKILRR